MKVLGLDVSTSNVGFCLLDTECSQSNGVLLAYGIPLGKTKGLYAKSCVVITSVVIASAMGMLCQCCHEGLFANSYVVIASAMGMQLHCCHNWLLVVGGWWFS